MGEGHGFVVVLGNDSRGLRSSEASEDEATFRAPHGSQRRPGGRERANDASLVRRDEIASTPYPLMGSDRVPSEVASFII